MKLHGRFKEDFEEWYKVDLFKEKNLTDAQKHEVKVFKLGHFYSQPFSMQYGVYQDFAFSKGIEISSWCNGWDIEKQGKDGFYYESEGLLPSIKVTRKQAVLKLMEKYNETK